MEKCSLKKENTFFVSINYWRDLLFRAEWDCLIFHPKIEIMLSINSSLLNCCPYRNNCR
nr:MAG TPA: hypothetical protein [Caudoviricetes sp.]